MTYLLQQTAPPTNGGATLTRRSELDFPTHRSGQRLRPKAQPILIIVVEGFLALADQRDVLGHLEGRIELDHHESLSVHF
ncbi:MAG: hypothetical protein ACFB0F_17580, partial [Neomegalonema sp.]